MEAICTAIICDPINAWIAGLLLIGGVCLLIPFFHLLTRNRK